MATAIKRRSVSFSGVSTSISIEDAFWNELRRMAQARSLKTNKLIAEIYHLCGKTDLSSAVRVFVLQHARQRPPTPSAKDCFLPP